MTFFNWVLQREYGNRRQHGDEDLLLKHIYKSFKPYSIWSMEMDNRSENGAVFNLEFSPNGNLLVAACQKKSIILYDTTTTKQVKTISNAHLDNVNCVKFLDNSLFATCSDDTTVALWDTRNLKQKIRSLHGHSNWVKNIEYSQKDNLLVTSGFDGSIYTWDINSYTEQGFIYQKVFHTSGLMRCRISPDATKLVICTTGGYLIIIHDLDLTTLAKDLCGFRPNIYRLMQLGRQFIPQAAKFDHIFSKSQKRNRVELISDFPERNDAEVVCALQIHPRGWCALSRNISYDEGSEWSCVHDIREQEENKDFNIESNNENKRKRKHSDSESENANNDVRLTDDNNREDLLENLPTSTNNIETNTNNNPNDTFVPDIWAAEVTVQDRACRTHRTGPRSSNSVNSYAYVYAISSGVIATTSSRNTSDWTIDTVLDNIPPRNVLRDRSLYMSIYNRQIYQNVRRLLYFIEEPNKGKGFIKEPSFSSDGRIICSPFGYGVRLLSFTNECSDLPTSVCTSKTQPEQLIEFKPMICHDDIVLSTKFSPRSPLLVTGCLRGRVVWYHPIL